MKFFVSALLLACLEGYYCAPLFEAFVPDSSRMTFGSQTNLDVDKLVHFNRDSAFNWNVQWPYRNPRRHDDYPIQGYGYQPQGYGYPPQGNGGPPQGYGYPPQGNGYPPQGNGYPSQGYGYPPQGNGYQQ